MIKNVDEKQLREFLKKIENALHFEIVTVSNATFKTIYQPKNKSFILLIRNDKKAFRIEMPIIKYVYLKQPKEDGGSMITAEAYNRLFTSQKAPIKDTFFIKKDSVRVKTSWCSIHRLNDDLNELRDEILNELNDLIKEEERF